MPRPGNICADMGMSGEDKVFARKRKRNQLTQYRLMLRVQAARLPPPVSDGTR